MPEKVDATAKSPKNVAKAPPTLQNRGGKVLLTLASKLRNFTLGSRWTPAKCSRLCRI